MMINLSKDTWTELKDIPRDLSDRPMTIAEIHKILNEAGCPLDHAIVQFQLELAGYFFRLYNGLTIWLGMPSEPDIDSWNNLWLCEFATYLPSSGEMGNLYMDQNGAVYYNFTAMPLASSVQIYLDSISFRKNLPKFNRPRISAGGDNQLQIRIEEVKILSQRLNQLGFVIKEEVSDGIESWWFGFDSNGYIHASRAKIMSAYDREHPISVVINMDTEEHVQEIVPVFDGLAEFPPRSKWRFIPAKK